MCFLSKIFTLYSFFIFIWINIFVLVEPVDNQLYISSDDLDLARVHNLRNPREIDTTLPSTSRENEIYMMQFRNEGGGKVYLYKMVLYKKNIHIWAPYIWKARNDVIYHIPINCYLHYMLYPSTLYWQLRPRFRECEPYAYNLFCTYIGNKSIVKYEAGYVDLLKHIYFHKKWNMLIFKSKFKGFDLWFLIVNCLYRWKSDIFSAMINLFQFQGFSFGRITWITVLLDTIHVELYNEV